MKRLLSSLLVVLLSVTGLMAMTPPRPRPAKPWATLSDAELGRKYMVAQHLCTTMRESSMRAVIAAEATLKPAMIAYASRLTEDALAYCRMANGLIAFLKQLDKEEAQCAAGGKCSPRSLERIQLQQEAQAAARELTGEEEVN